MERNPLVPGSAAAWELRPPSSSSPSALRACRPGEAVPLPCSSGSGTEQRSGLEGASCREQIPRLPCAPRRWETANSLRRGGSGCRGTGSPRRRRGKSTRGPGWALLGGRVGPLSGTPLAQALVTLCPVAQLFGGSRTTIFSLFRLNASHLNQRCPESPAPAPAAP